MICPDERLCNAKPLLCVRLLPRHRIQAPLHSLTLDLEQFHALQEQVIALPLPRALDAEDEVIAHTPQLDLVLELRVPQTLPTHSVFQWIINDSFRLALLALELGIIRDVLGRHFIQLNHAARKAARKLLRVGASNGFYNVDGG
jgi:hypothetical protein